jgi:6-pyruvoyltetrahydropterin/6-carboxytetrahydropterin synthase
MTAASQNASGNAGSGQVAYRSTKTYGHNEGLSCCFRQWHADHSHCRFLHGYALAFRFVFAAESLDANHWCLDFGSLKPVRAWLHEMFDHTVLIAEDDPELAAFEQLAGRGLIVLRLVPLVGCEAFARLAFDHVQAYVDSATGGRVRVESVEVSEHGANSAICMRRD